MKRSGKASRSGILRNENAAELAVSEQELRERIAQRAYDFYQNRGETHGRDVEDWLEAERLVLAQFEEDRRSKIKMPRQRSNRSRKDKAAETR